MIRNELQDYLTSVYPFSGIESESKLSGKITIRFDLIEKSDEDLDKISIASADRASLLFSELFPNNVSSFWILIYEYATELEERVQTDYLYKHFTEEVFSEFYNEMEIIDANWVHDEMNANGIPGQQESRIIIGKITTKDLDLNSIFLGIANHDNELEPFITQYVYFFEESRKVGFHMADSHGCFLWSDDPVVLKPVYDKYYEWISKDTKEDLIEFFGD